MNLVQKYTPSTNVWETLGNEADLPFNFKAADLDAAGGILFAFGGSGSGNFSEILYVSTINPNEGWKILENDESLPIRNAHTMTAIGGVMYVYGGWNGTQYFSDTWYFDASALYLQKNATWVPSYSTAKPPPRNSHTAVAFGGNIIVFGGFYHNTSQVGASCNNPLDDCLYYNDIWIYMPISDKWTQLMPNGDAPVARWGHSAAVLGEDMYVFGGTIAAGTVINDLWGYNFPYGVWQKLSPSGASPSGRFTQTMVTIGDSIIMYGGNNMAGANYNEIWSYSPHKGVGDTEDDLEEHTVGIKASLIVAILLSAIIAMFSILVYRHVAGGSSTYVSGVTSSATYGPLMNPTSTST